MHEQSMKCSTRNKDHNDSRGLEPTTRKEDGGSRLKLRNFIDVKSYKKKKIASMLHSRVLIHIQSSSRSFCYSYKVLRTAIKYYE